jgi:hypothetical protein
VDAGQLIIIGEVHGGIAAPCMFEAIARRLIADGRPLAFGFEDSGGTEAHRDLISAAIAEAHSDEAMDLVLETPSWSVRPFDGRQTLAMARLYQLAFNHVAGQPDRIQWLATGEAPPQIGKRDEMTRRLHALSELSEPDTVVMAIMGNNWSGGYTDSVCTQLMERGIDPLCIEVHPRGQREDCSWRIGTPAEIGLWGIRGWEDPVDLELHTPCEQRGPSAIDVMR